jgi:uncharacterized membrane protein
MHPIDRPFRFTLDFCAVWAMLAIPTCFLIRGAKISPWYSDGAALILFPLFCTFVRYGPVLLARQIVRSGSHGWFVARVLLSILIFAILVFGGLCLSGAYTETKSHYLAFSVPAFAIVYLHWRLRREPSAQQKD